VSNRTTHCNKMKLRLEQATVQLWRTECLASIEVSLYMFPQRVVEKYHRRVFSILRQSCSPGRGRYGSFCSGVSLTNRCTHSSVEVKYPAGLDHPCWRTDASLPTVAPRPGCPVLRREGSICVREWGDRGSSNRSQPIRIASRVAELVLLYQIRVGRQDHGTGLFGCRYLRSRAPGLLAKTR